MLAETEQLTLPVELWPDVTELVTEDDTPVDNIPSEKQQRLLTEPLYSSWMWLASGGQRIFLACANVGIFAIVRQPPLVPDMFLSLNVEPAEDWWDKNNRTYFVWEFGKVPEVVIEVVSNLKGNELGSKRRDYARIGVPYYAVYDPAEQLGQGKLNVFELGSEAYIKRETAWLPRVGLGLTLWHGTYEARTSEWLRWCDEQGNVIPTGAEAYTQERQRAERLAAKLRELGVDYAA
jgi:hypothetical protein